jgi:NAD(P)-dependent dehydrogenase (short-subunit alcohol dehydrogenase family)
MAVILITACSTGIGQETALALAGAGHTVYASCRNPGSADELRSRIAESGLPIPVLRLDLLDQASIDAAINTVVEEQGRIDVLVNNAAIGAGRALEETSLEEIREVYETNVFGCHGTYSSSKAALETFCMALAQELAEHKVSVSVITPGCVLTPMWTKGAPPPEDSAYLNSFGRFASWCEFGLGRAATPADCASAISSAIEDEQPRFRYPVGPDAEDYWRAYQALNDPEEWMRIACLDNAAYAERMADLMGVDYYAGQDSQ